MYFFLHCYCFLLQFDLNESRLSRSLQRTSKYAPNMREPKNERKTSANPPDTFEASFRTEAPDSAADRASRSPKPVGVVVHRSSFVVRCSSFVVYRRLVSVVSCSLVGLVVCLAHNTIAAMFPPLSHTSLSLAASMLLLPRLSGVFPCSTLGCLGDVFNAKQAAVKRMFVAVVAVVALVFLLFFGGCSS